MENLSIYNKVRKVPDEAKKLIGGGRLKGFTDINPMWRIKTLTDQFGVCGFGWYYDIVSQELKSGASGEIAAFVTINLFVKIGEDWSKPIQGLGGSMFVSNEKNGAYNSDECFKMALTDALSTSCKALGLAADVYFEKDRTKYDAKPEQPQAPKQPELDEAIVTSIKNALSECKSQAAVKKIWDNNSELHTSKQFIKLVTDRKNVLIQNGIE